MPCVSTITCGFTVECSQRALHSFPYLKISSRLQPRGLPPQTMSSRVAARNSRRSRGCADRPPQPLLLLELCSATLDDIVYEGNRLGCSLQDTLRCGKICTALWLHPNVNPKAIADVMTALPCLRVCPSKTKPGWARL